MIYLDCAATSLQKPPAVSKAIAHAAGHLASPGRGSHKAAMLAADKALDCRTAIAELFNVPEPDNVIFTLNATHALNIAIHSLVSKGKRVVISGYEHNSVTRPLYYTGADIRIADAPLFDSDAIVQAFDKELPGAACCVCCHVSNVFGFILPLPEIAAMCRKYSVPLIIDASQSAGAVDVDFQALGAAFIAAPGHKGLLGPQGTGILLCGKEAFPLMQGGTGSRSALSAMPEFLPDRLEAGTLNITGIAGLFEGVKYVLKKTPARILHHEQQLLQSCAAELNNIAGIKIFRCPDGTKQAGVLSFISEKYSSEEVAERLGAMGVAVRAGLHCSPTAHKTAGTFETGTVRMSFSPFNTMSEVTQAAAKLKQIMK